MPQKTSRRRFLQTAGAATAAIGFPTVIPASALGKDGATAPSNRINMGWIGTGGRGSHLLDVFMYEEDMRAVAVCDVDSKHLGRAQQMVNERYENKDCKAYHDFRELLARKDIDAVFIATPDHWHALTAVAAANAGKDIYCEKPLANSIGESRAIVDAVAKNHRVLQTGSHERAGKNARYACELVRNGVVGKIHTMRINMPCDQDHHKRIRKFQGIPPETAIPSELDWNFWLGHTSKAPYNAIRAHFHWRFILAHGGGEMTDRGAHVIDLGQLGMNKDHTGPVTYEAKGVQTEGSVFDAYWDYEWENVYADGLRMIGSAKGPRGVRFEGEDGWIFIHVHGADLEASDPKLLKTPSSELKTKLGRSPGHVRDFLDSVKSRKKPFAHEGVGHHTAVICHINNMAMKLGRKLTWNPETEQFKNDAEANSLITPKMRAPWKL